MKLSELMASYTPNADFEGFVTNDDRLLRGRLRYG